MIFEDPSKKRWKNMIMMFSAVSAIAVVLIAITVYSFVVNSPIPSLAKINMLKGKALKNKIVVSQKNDHTAYLKENPNQAAINALKEKQLMSRIRHELSKDTVLPRFSNRKLLHTGFVVQGDPLSVSDTRKHLNDLDLVIPDWFSFTGKSNEIDEQVDKSLADYFKEQKALVYPKISNIDRQGNWQGDAFSAYLNDYSNMTQLAETIDATLNKYDVDGVNLDFEALDKTAKNNYLDFLVILRNKLHKDHRYLTVDVPMNDEAFDYEAIGQIADSVFVMAYDEHYTGGESGPIASRDWFENGISDMLLKIPKEKLIVAFGQYSYDWNTGKKTPAVSRGFDETMMLANDVGANIDSDTNSYNSSFSYLDGNKQTHRVWLLDAVSMWNEIAFLEKYSVYGVSFWRMGLEDPTIWDYFPLDRYSEFNPKLLESVKTLNTVNFEGQGEILKIAALPKTGKRNMTLDGRFIDYSNYQKLPESFDVQKYGKLPSNKLALTFDDGPDPTYTPEILDILKQNNVKATFFVVGDQMQRYPDVVKRAAGEGHLIGNHTYFHPDLSKQTASSVRIELNSVQRLIEAITGKQTLLFRAPYNTDSTPSTKDEIKPLYEAGQMGYIIVDADIDSMDYDKPGVNGIVSNVVGQLKDSGSNVIVFHDAGGNRDQTVKALKILIPKLKGMGYEFVNVNDLLGVPVKSLMPAIDFKEQLIITATKVWDFIYVKGWTCIVVLFFLSTIISILRILFLGFFVLRSERALRGRPSVELEEEPFVTVIVPAYNEEKVISKTLDGLLRSSYQNFEVLVVDDGSKDSTCAVVEDYVQKHPGIRLLKKQNGGKFSALNLGFEQTTAEYVVTIDADTMILPDTIRNLMLPFSDPEVDAVCGNVQVGNVKNILTGFQAVEYITTQNYDRRAFDELNCISVVPGATGAWRRSKVLEAGGYSDLTLTEDADLTLTMLEKGAKIVYAPQARSITEAPESIIALFKQRFRWSYGTFQCLWKHKKNFFNGSMGWIALPNMFVFQIVFPILSPIGDLVFLLSIFRKDVMAILSGYILFLLMDLAASLFAFTIEKAPKKYMLFVLIQRFFYRQFMYVVTFKSIFAAIKGRKHGWNKLDRTNSVEYVK